MSRRATSTRVSLAGSKSEVLENAIAADVANLLKKPEQGCGNEMQRVTVREPVRRVSVAHFRLSPAL